MKLLLTSYYELKEQLLCVSTSLKKAGFTVINYPLLQKYADANDKLDNYVEHFCDFIKTENPNVILWWFFSIPTVDFEIIYNTSKQINNNIKHVLFNWDDPFNWHVSDMQNKAKFFDVIFATSAEKLDDYVTYGAKKSYLLYPGYDSTLHYPIFEDNNDDVNKYECDISICCTNLYENINDYPNQYILRRKLVDDIYENQEKYNYKFHIYGPEKFKELYPKSYRGFIKYEDTNKVFNYSKINICTHVQCNTKKYLNERTVLILASGGLLYIDKINELEQVLDINNECIVIDKNDYIQQITNILHNYEKYYIFRSNGRLRVKKLTWDDWATFIYENI